MAADAGGPPQPFSIAFGPERRHSPLSDAWRMLPRKNHKITAPVVRVVGTDGKQKGVFPIQEALNMARGLGMDLVEVVPNATPPITRIVAHEPSLKTKERLKNN